MPIIKQIVCYLNTYGGFFSFLGVIGNAYGGFFSFLGVIGLVVTFITSLLLQRKRHFQNQLGLLRVLKWQLNYLGGQQEIRVRSDARYPHLRWYKTTLKAGDIPPLDMEDIDPNRYIFELDEEIKGESTYELKILVSWVHNDVTLVNNLTRKLLELNLANSPSEIKIKELRCLVDKSITSLQKLIPKAIKEIDMKWLH